jgi:hypothetical protein
VVMVVVMVVMIVMVARRSVVAHSSIHPCHPMLVRLRSPRTRTHPSIPCDRRPRRPRRLAPRRSLRRCVVRRWLDTSFAIHTVMHAFIYAPSALLTLRSHHSIPMQQVPTMPPTPVSKNRAWYLVLWVA